MGLKILFSSNGLHTKTGYGNQTRINIPRLFGLGHEVALFAWYGLEGGSLNTQITHQGKSYALPIYPKGREGYGNDVVGAHALNFKADIVISLIDAWVLNPEAHSPQGIRFCPWLPVDMEPIPPPVLTVIKQAFQPIVYSRFAERMCADAGITAAYVPHSVETDVFCPGSHADARAALGWPADKFIVGMVAANKGFPSRKSYPEQFEAFARFAAEHDDAVLYCHTNKGEDDGMGGVNLPELARLLGIETKVMFPDAYQLLMGFSDNHMVNLYRAFDVLLSVSMGEGFGIPILEAQAAGCPVIVGDWTAMSELCFGGWMVAKRDAHKCYTPLAAYQWAPSPEAIRECLEASYHERGMRSEEARAGALSYDADLVANMYWKPVLEDIEARLHGATTLETRMRGLVKVAA